MAPIDTVSCTTPAAAEGRRHTSGVPPKSKRYPRVSATVGCRRNVNTTDFRRSILAVGRMVTKNRVATNEIK